MTPYVLPFKLRVSGPGARGIDYSQLSQSRFGLVFQACMLMITVCFLCSDVLGGFWKNRYWFRAKLLWLLAYIYLDICLIFLVLADIAVKYFLVVGSALVKSLVHYDNTYCTIVDLTRLLISHVSWRDSECRWSPVMHMTSCSVWWSWVWPSGSLVFYGTASRQNSYGSSTQRKYSRKLILIKVFLCRRKQQMVCTYLAISYQHLLW